MLTESLTCVRHFNIHYLLNIHNSVQYCIVKSEWLLLGWCFSVCVISQWVFIAQVLICSFQVQKLGYYVDTQRLTDPGKLIPSDQTYKSLIINQNINLQISMRKLTAKQTEYSCPLVSTFYSLWEKKFGEIKLRIGRSQENQK